MFPTEVPQDGTLVEVLSRAVPTAPHWTQVPEGPRPWLGTGGASLPGATTAPRLAQGAAARDHRHGALVVKKERSLHHESRYFVPFAFLLGAIHK